MPVGNALGVRGDMDIKDAYIHVGGRVMHDSKDGGGRATQEAKAEEQLPSDLFLIDFVS